MSPLQLSADCRPTHPRSSGLRPPMQRAPGASVQQRHLVVPARPEDQSGHGRNGKPAGSRPRPELSTSAPLSVDPRMQAVVELAERAAASDATVLVTGDSGTGKEVIARFVHARSPRAAGPFIAVNCAAIPAELLEAELFGHERGAFTGAVARREGCFEAADGGTLLLDEVTEMDVRLQAKLLRAIQERRIDRLGGQRAMPVDVRIIATSNRDVEAAMSDGNLREDLYYRLSVVNLELPPLRLRPLDLLPLAEHFLAQHRPFNGPAGGTLTAAAIQRLRQYDWPGNVRELENCMQRASILAPEGPIDADALSFRSRTPARAVGCTLAQMERELIERTLGAVGGNRTRAAAMLGISIRTLRSKLQLYAQGSKAPVRHGSRLN